MSNEHKFSFSLDSLMNATRYVAQWHPCRHGIPATGVMVPCPYCRQVALESERNHLLRVCEDFIQTLNMDDATNEEVEIVAAAEAVRLRINGYPVDLPEAPQEARQLVLVGYINPVDTEWGGGEAYKDLSVVQHENPEFGYTQKVFVEVGK